MSAQSANASRRIGVTGASGQVGYFLVPRLLQLGYHVIALSRRPRPQTIAAHPRLHWHQGALEQDWPDGMPIDGLLSAGPLDALADALDRCWPEALRQVIALSSTSVGSKSSSPDPAERALAARLAAAEATLQAACRRHDATLVLLRPTMIYGCGRDHSLTPLLAQVRRWRLLPLPWPAHGLRQPVHADDLAVLMMACIDRPELDGHSFDAGGGERLSFAAMLQRAARAAGGRYLPLPLPTTLLRLLLPGRRGAMARLSDDLIAADDDARLLPAWRPRAFRPTAADFENRTTAYVPEHKT